jgi:hypothetical protein
MQLVRWITITSSALVAVLLLAHVALGPNADRANSEQYAVYSAYIEPDLTGESHSLGSRDEVILILRNTIISDQFVNGSKAHQYRFLFATAGHAKRAIPQLRRTVLLEFFLANLHTKRLETRFRLTAKYELLTQEETRSYASTQFTHRFPHSYGYLTFSRVAFNRDLTEAFFYTEHVCGLCGEGKYVFMRRLHGKWVVESTSSTWIS